MSETPTHLHSRAAGGTRRARPVRSTLLPVLAVAGAGLLTQALLPAMQRPTFTLFIAAVLVSAWLGGLLAGILASVLSVLVLEYFFLDPTGELVFFFDDFVQVAVFLSVAVLVSFLVTRAERARQEAERHARQRQETEERFQVMADAAPVLIWVSGAEQAYTYFNRPWLEFTGRSAEQEAGEGWMEGIHPADREHCLGASRRAFEQRAPFTREYRLRRQDGEYRWLLDHGVPRRAADGAFLGFIGSAVDITPRIEAEQAMRKSQERLRVAQKAAGLGTWEWEISRGRIHWSEEIPALHGLPPMSFDGDDKEWLKLAVHPEDQAYVQQAIERALRGDAEYDLEFRTQWPDGSVHWIGARAQVARDAAGQPERMVGIAMDVTARKHTEEAMRMTEKLAAAGRLAATISHEINNPLEAATNLLYLLEHHSPLEETARQYARLAQEELARVAHISRQTLSFYREAADPAAVEVNVLVEEVLGLLARRIRSRAVKVRKRMDAVPPVMGFAGELRQVVSNLLVNAVDAVPEGGQVQVRVRAAREWGGQGRRGVMLTVADNGSGIRAEHRRSIFEPFFTTKGERGTGLGLWVTHGIVQKHGGSIRVRSVVGPERRGTCFAVFLPLQSASVRAASSLSA